MDVRAELKALLNSDAPNGKIVAGRVPSTGEAETHVTTLWALRTWPPGRSSLEGDDGIWAWRRRQKVGT